MVTMSDMVSGTRFQKPNLDPGDCEGPVELVVYSDGTAQLKSVESGLTGLVADDVEEMLEFLNEVDAYVVKENSDVDQ